MKVENQIDRRSTYIDFFDPMRGIAILGVFLFHALDFLAKDYAQMPWGEWFRTMPTPRWLVFFTPGAFGQMGVALFFVISGFCIHLSQLQEFLPAAIFSDLSTLPIRAVTIRHRDSEKGISFWVILGLATTRTSLWTDQQY
jgi:peptidoglycan/LPS O-acetylase OafA/YrhL